MRRALRRLTVLGAAFAVLSLAGQGTASAHPLGNFTVNHYDGLTLHPDRIDLHAVVDSAEIPTRQQQPQVDTDGDGTTSDAEGRAHATEQCNRLAAAVSAAVDGEPLRWTVRSVGVTYPPGQGNLPTTRLTCELSAAAELDDVATVTFSDAFRDDRIGWREITAVGSGVALPQSPVPARSVSDELRNYPGDLLTDPLDVRAVTLNALPGGVSSVRAGAPVVETGVGVLDRLAAWADRRFTDIIGSELTPLVGGLAVLLAVLLGASHAVLPGHGKTLIAAYLAGRRGTTRDALVVGGTVTVTHTAGVLVVGLLLSAFASLLGEQILGWLGIVSGVLVAVIGAALLRSALLSRRGAPMAVAEPAVGASHGHGRGHGHGHEHEHEHEHGHEHGHVLGGGSRLDRNSLFGMGVAAGLVPSPTALVVLFVAIGLSRTWFGVVLVLGYGIGMAATLTAVGLLLVRLRDRLESRLAQVRDSRFLSGVATATPVVTAMLVLVVGLGLAARGLVGTV